ncbi:MAG TPA: GNAT family N-acetyltransferase [Polyangiaceae bacterium]|jgi:ribosomal protein S18 acetylase RimI-like enzyme|nr:GNAT family N-acetyltransferase [Polyangiaceae bacterium]
MLIRPALATDRDSIWSVLEPTIRAGETNALPLDMNREDALAYWCAPGHEVFVAEQADTVLGSYFLRANQLGGGSHVANCAYVVAPSATGRGIAQNMCEHSLERARARGFLAMQFNFVVESNERALRLWQRAGFSVVGRLPKAFAHPSLGYVDALVMHRAL